MITIILKSLSPSLFLFLSKLLCRYSIRGGGVSKRATNARYWDAVLKATRQKRFYNLLSAVVSQQQEFSGLGGQRHTKGYHSF